MQERPKRVILLEDIVQQDREKLCCLKCQICKNILELAYTDICGHIFCRDCGMPAYQTEKKCPVTGLDLNIEPVAVPYIDTIINEALVYCQNRTKNCEWQGAKSKLEQHMKEECTFELLLSPIERCGESTIGQTLKPYYEENLSPDYNNCQYCYKLITNLSLVSHSLVCESFQEICNCGQSIAKNILKYHECPKALVQCPNLCGDNMQREFITDHMHICQNRLVSCQYCTESIVFKYLSAHNLFCGSFELPCPNLCGQLISRN
jgi:hypothetical protein